LLSGIKQFLIKAKQRFLLRSAFLTKKRCKKLIKVNARR
jgi:hypothetical protein